MKKTTQGQVFSRSVGVRAVGEKLSHMKEPQGNSDLGEEPGFY